MFRFALCVLVLCCGLTVSAAETVYGPFYAGSVTTQQWGSAWANIGNVAGAPDSASATTTVGFDQVSNSIDATNFGSTIPPATSVKEVWFRIVGTWPNGLNDSAYCLLPSWDETSMQAPGWFRFDNTEAATPLTAGQVNAANFGFVWAICNLGSDAVVAVDAVEMIVVCE